MSARLRDWFRAAPVVVASPEAGATDGALVRQFAETRDERAFATLLHRHGPMVLATCRRILHPDVHTADDAFQATFLVLATKAAGVSPPERVGAWLHGVAVHVAQKARAWARKLVSSAPAELDRVPAMPFETDPDLVALRGKIDDALAGLPSKYRSAVILCDLEGRTRAEAALLLGWSEGTLSGRLARARKLLADRLRRRGVVVPAVSLGVLLPASAALATVPGQLAASSLRAAALVAVGAATGEAIPAPVAALVRGVPMHTTNFKLLAAGLVVVVALGAFGLYALTAAPPVPPPLPPGQALMIAAPVPNVPAKNWRAKHTFAHKAAVGAIAFDRDRVAAGDNAGCLILWDAKTGEKELLVETATLVGAPREVVSISSAQFSPDGKAIYFSLGDGTTIQRCSLDKDKKEDRIFPGHFQHALPNPHGLTPDGKYWLESLDFFDPDRTDLQIEANLMRDFDRKLVGAPEVIFAHGERVARAVIGSLDLVVSISETGVLRRWKKGIDKPVWENDLVERGKKFRPIDTALALCPLNKLVAVSIKSGEVRVYSAETGKVVVTLKGHAGVVNAMAFGTDGKQLVTAGADKTARVWNVETGKELVVLEGHTDAVTAVAFGGDTITTGSADKTVRVWERK